MPLYTIIYECNPDIPLYPQYIPTSHVQARPAKFLSLNPPRLCWGPRGQGVMAAMEPHEILTWELEFTRFMMEIMNVLPANMVYKGVIYIYTYIHTCMHTYIHIDTYRYI